MILSRGYGWGYSELRPYLWALAAGIIIGAASFISPFLGLGVVALVVVFYASLSRPVVLLCLYTLAVVLLSGMPRNLLIPLLVPNEPLLALTIGLGTIIILMTNAGRQSREKIAPIIIVAIVLYFVGTSLLPMLVYLMRGWRFSIAEMFNLLAPIQYLLLFWLYAQLPRNAEERLTVLHFMVFCSSIVSITGLLQAANFGPMLSILQQFYPSIHLSQAAESGRITAILNSWNSLGNFLFINLVLILSIAGLRRGFLWNLNLGVALLLNVACLLGSGSFASIGGLVLAVAITKYFDRRGLKLLMWLIGICILAAIILYPIISMRLEYQFGGPGNSGTPQTLAYRFYLWENIFLPALAKDNGYVWGISPLLNSGIFTWAWTENQYLFLLIRSGLVSLIAHTAWVMMTLIWLRRLMKGGQEIQRVLAVVVFALLITLTIMGMTNEVFTNSGSMDYLWILMGLTAKGGDSIANSKPKHAIVPAAATANETG